MTLWSVARQSPLSMDSPGKNTGVGYRALLQGIFSTLGLNLGLLHCRKILYNLSHLKNKVSLPQGKLKNTGVGSLSLLQGNFLTQRSNWGLLHCRKILYQLSYQGSSLRMRVK